MRASYRRLKGTEQFLGFYDVHADCLSGLFRRRKRVLDISKAFCYLRRCYPRKRLFVILDNLHHVHDHPRFLALLRRLHIRPVWTPTEASWPIPTTPPTWLGVDASTPISATATANSPTYVTRSTASAHLGLSSWNGTSLLETKEFCGAAWPSK